MDMNFITTLIISFQFLIPVAIIWAIIKFVKYLSNIRNDIKIINDKLDKLTNK